MMQLMETAWFNFEFFEHVPARTRKSLLDRFAEWEASVDELGGGRFRVNCYTHKNHRRVGRMLLCPATSRICTVTEAGGAAELSLERYAGGTARLR